MHERTQYFCSINQYDQKLLVPLSELMANIHRLAQATSARYRNNHQPLDTYIYSASTIGMLAAMIFAQYPLFRVRGYLDQKGSLLNTISHDLGIFLEPARTVIDPDTQECPTSVDLIVCATAPAHYEIILKKLQEKWPATPVVFIHHSEKVPCVIPLGKIAPKPILVATTGRCGTHWLKSMFRFLLGANGFNEVIAASSITGQRIIDQHIFTKMLPRQYTIDHFQLTPELRNYINQDKIKAVFLYRDPRDIQVSNAYYWNKEFSFNLNAVVQRTKQILEWKKLNNVYLLRYEDLVNDMVGSLDNLQKFLKIATPRSTLKKIAEVNSFRYLSVGRSPGESDNTHHYRKGIVGDWKNHYTEEHKEAVKATCGRKLIEIGYEYNFDW
ncbi:MAG: sulfotransferase domain-containing protein [Deltaproteobacteria bacterium]|nr:sulfotransferase domain-containing protein [Deltaproteobacteria bacterium]MBW2153072.1 sulfotransferase domain-containing protein [Deltaproteobacteria bacterium]